MIDIKLYKKYIIEILDVCIKQNKRKLILYPNGEITSIVKKLLMEVYHINPIFIVDNYKFDQKTVFNFEKAEQMTEKDMYYLVCSDNELLYDDIRNTLKMHIKDEQIIDLFPDVNTQEYCEKIEKILEKINEEIENMEI